MPPGLVRTATPADPDMPSGLVRALPAAAIRSRTRTAFVGSTSALRLCLTPVVAALALAGLDVAAAVTFAVAASTDYVDGWLARRWRVTTTTGSFLDTTADKVLVAGVLIALTSLGQASAWAVMIIVCREVLIMGLRGAVAASGRVIKPSPLGRTKAAVQFVAILLLLLRVNLRLGPTGIGEWALWIAVLMTVISAGDYLVRWADVTLRHPATTPPR